MIRLAVVAERQVAELFGHFGRLERPKAARDLLTALDHAIARISRDPTAGLTAPRSYPALAPPDRAWLKSGRHWVTYSLTLPPVILGVFYETADIPKRINEIMEQTAWSESAAISSRGKRPRSPVPLTWTIPRR